MRKIITLIILLLAISIIYIVYNQFLSSPADLQKLSQNLGPKLSQQLQNKGLKIGNPIFIRIFKQPAILELWLKNETKYQLFKTYPICYYSGNLGPKLKEGDKQAPEGFYYVSKAQMNPNSHFHLSFNIGFPNKYDRDHGRTGSYLMVHGNCVSVGCYAMTDKVIEEIYLLAEAALNNGQEIFRVHIFPFPMHTQNMQKHSKSQWQSFWQNLKEGYDWFENKHIPPNVEVENGKYIFDDDL